MIHENGTLLAESERFLQKSQAIYGEVDLDRLIQDRMRMTTFRQNARIHGKALRKFRKIPLTVKVPDRRILLTREIPRFPYIPADPEKRDQRCYEVYNIQVQGLAKRLQSAGMGNVVIGVSGGLDSAHALIVAARTMDLLGRPRSRILAYTMPGFATTGKTYGNALRLMRSLDVEVNELDIRPSSMQMFHDIGHPFRKGKAVYDTDVRNVPRRESGLPLFRIANHRTPGPRNGGPERACPRWCTYGVGDHMSHYAVNASVPKTLIQHLIGGSPRRIFPADFRILLDILNKEISPELIPGDGGDQPVQKSESVIGPYELQDSTISTSPVRILPS
jgi:NAD+ synthase (glutamine-hydrolysing)